MSFMSLIPKAPKVPTPANAPISANASSDAQPQDTSATSLINTGPTGLSRKASTQRTSLIGGGM